MQKWQSENNEEPKDAMVFEFLSINHTKEDRTRGFHRATARRIQAARERLQAHTINNNLQLGPIQTQHLAVVNVR